jgi:hypothetical protein
LEKDKQNETLMMIPKSEIVKYFKRRVDEEDCKFYMDNILSSC